MSAAAFATSLVACQSDGGDAPADADAGADTMADGNAADDDGMGDDDGTGGDGPAMPLGPSDAQLVPDNLSTCFDGFPVQTNPTFRSRSSAAVRRRAPRAVLQALGAAIDDAGAEAQLAQRELDRWRAPVDATDQLQGRAGPERRVVSRSHAPISATA
ncbi:MAG: hypothetical protein IAG13_34295 [Deltaproteobacteria bacterium]|nr:hypothetical protein [Nannocystaceae bacterium]